MNTRSLTTQASIIFLLVVSLSGKADQSISVSDAAAKEVSYIAIGELPLDGGYGNQLGLTKIVAAEKSDTIPFSEKEIRAMWSLSATEATLVNGISWSGTPLQVKIKGTKSNEFGPVFDIELVNESTAATVKSDGPPIYWTGHLNVTIQKPIKAQLSSLDRLIVTSECKVRGLELKHNLENEISDGVGSVWYIDPLDQEQRRDIADPTKDENILVRVLAPTANSNALLVGCSYKSITQPDVMSYRGPVFAYDSAYHAVQWRRAIDLDGLTFLSIGSGGSVYMVEATSCDQCETFGYQLTPFAFKARNNGDSGKAEGSDFYIFDDENSVRIGRSVSWFPGPE
jgi:hypothetical protein